MDITLFFIQPLILIILLTGCGFPPVKHWAESGIGRHVSVIEQLMARSDSYASKIRWEKNTYHLTNGNWVLVDPIRENCFVHWEVNNNEIIVGYKTEGTNCY